MTTLAPDWDTPAKYGVRPADTLRYDIDQHYVRNPDLSNSEVLELCGALTCPQARLFAFIEQLLDPVARRGAEQSDLAAALSNLLGADGFAVASVGQVSRHPLYRVQRIAAGVAGTPKNLIFAAIKEKPDLYLIDAINTDVAIRNASDALIYDRLLPEGTLSWRSMVEWWMQCGGIDDFAQARTQLYRRLLQSVREGKSLGEYALFDTYYRSFAPALGDALPALIPQVYLHYDPLTLRQRRNERVLPRQRMGLLLLLEHNVRVVVEVDGRHHYADGETASPARYAEMVAEDRRLRLAGYELYRFGAAEFIDAEFVDGRFEIGERARALATRFFEQLFAKHGVQVDSAVAR